MTNRSAAPATSTQNKQCWRRLSNRAARNRLPPSICPSMILAGCAELNRSQVEPPWTTRTFIRPLKLTQRPEQVADPTRQNPPPAFRWGHFATCCQRARHGRRVYNNSDSGLVGGGGRIDTNFRVAPAATPGTGSTRRPLEKDGAEPTGFLRSGGNRCRGGHVCADRRHHIGDPGYPDPMLKDSMLASSSCRPVASSSVQRPNRCASPGDVPLPVPLAPQRQLPGQGARPDPSGRHHLRQAAWPRAVQWSGRPSRRPQSAAYGSTACGFDGRPHQNG